MKQNTFRPAAQYKAAFHIWIWKSHQ